MTEVQINQTKGQLEASVSKVEPYLNQDEFADYCDALYTCVAYIAKIKQRVTNSDKPINSDVEESKTA